MADDPNRIDLPGGYFIGPWERDMGSIRFLCGQPQTEGSPPVTVGTIDFDAATAFAAAMLAAAAGGRDPNRMAEALSIAASVREIMAERDAATARADAAEARVRFLEADAGVADLLIVENAHLKVENSRLDNLCAEWSRQNVAVIAICSKAEQRVKQLEAAIRPFADYAGRLGPGAPAWADATGRYDFSITVADLRRARAAIAGTQPAPEPPESSKC